jgi:hypothetical protein
MRPLLCVTGCSGVFNEAEIRAAQNCRWTGARRVVSRQPRAIKGGGDARNPIPSAIFIEHWVCSHPIRKCEELESHVMTSMHLSE